MSGVKNVSSKDILHKHKRPPVLFVGRVFNLGAHRALRVLGAAIPTPRRLCSRGWPSSLVPIVRCQIDRPDQLTQVASSR